jgi:hypothetical protein
VVLICLIALQISKLRSSSLDNTNSVVGEGEMSGGCDCNKSGSGDGDDVDVVNASSLVDHVDHVDHVDNVDPMM